MNNPARRFSKTSAILAGSLCGIVLAMVWMTIWAVYSDVNDPPQIERRVSALQLVLKLLPGILMVGTIFALPTATAMVLTIRALSKRFPWLDRFWAWMLVGIVFTAPTSWFFSHFQPGSERFALVSVWSFGLLIGALSGLAAWTFRLRPALGAAAPDP